MLDFPRSGHIIMAEIIISKVILQLRVLECGSTLYNNNREGAI